MTDNLNWPPCYNDLTTENIDLGNFVSTFLNVILSGKIGDPESSRMHPIKLSLGQDMIYNVSNGRIRTPKSILFPYNIKMLTNNTEIINMTSNRLGHGICYSLLEKIETENAYKVIDEQTDLVSATRTV